MVPLRELGVQVEGSLFAERATYEAGFFNGTEDGADANFAWSGSNETTGRVLVKPFALAASDHLRELAIGVGGSAGHEHGALPTYKTVGQQTFFKYRTGAYTEGQHVRVSPQGNYFRGPLGVMAEYVVSDVQARMDSSSGKLRNAAWEVSGSYFLTGGRNNYGITEPAHSFNPAHPLRETGAWEIAFRHSEARLDKTAFPTFADPSASAKEAAETASGVSWYLNRWTKLMVFYENTTFSPGAANLSALAPERLVATRLLLAF